MQPTSLRWPPHLSALQPGTTTCTHMHKITSSPVGSKRSTGLHNMMSTTRDPPPSTTLPLTRASIGRGRALALPSPRGRQGGWDIVANRDPYTANSVTRHSPGVITMPDNASQHSTHRAHNTAALDTPGLGCGATHRKTHPHPHGSVRRLARSVTFTIEIPRIAGRARCEQEAEGDNRSAKSPIRSHR